jgi:very-short-patch-repair endonuclease
MATVSDRVRSGRAWDLEKRQHGVVTRAQLAELGFSAAAIRHKLAQGRLHRLMRGVYAVGRPEVGELGNWMAATLACGPHALLSHRSAAALLGIRRPQRYPSIEVVAPAHSMKRVPGVRAYRRAPSCADRQPVSGDGRSIADVNGIPMPLRWRLARNIPVTGPAVVLVDLASCLPAGQVEAAVNEADHLELVDPEALRTAIDLLPRRPGLRRLRDLLDAAGLALTTTELERRFRPLVLETGLPMPVTQAHPSSYRVDFYWEGLGLVVETDSLRYHRTAFKQAADRRRDNEHMLSGLVTLRFTHGQIAHEQDYVRGKLKRARQLAVKLDH